MSGYPERHVERARSLRTSGTEAERILWRELRGRRLAGAKFRRQQPIGDFIVDFVCQEHRLVVELDGSQHVDNAYDRRRDAWLEMKGYCVLRFWNDEVSGNLEGILAAIVAALGEEPSPTSTSERARKSSYPLPKWERRGSL